MDSPTCFFCMKRRPKLMLTGLNLPPPLPHDLPILMCRKCSRLSAEEKARHITAHVNNVRAIHNRRVEARRRAEMN